MDIKKRFKHSDESKEKMRMANKGKHLSPATEFKKGQKLSEETKKKMSIRMKKNGSPWNKGRIPWNKGLTIKDERVKNNISVARETRKKNKKPAWNKGKKGLVKQSVETRLRMKQSSYKGEKSHLWRGGITPKNSQLRNSIEFRLWREAVFARDNWTCQKTGIKGGKLHPHHIKNFSQYPELRFAIDNGITLSDKSHREFHKKYGIQNNTYEQLQEFIK